MSKQELQQHYNLLDKLNDEFSRELSDYNDGSNAKIRDSAYCRLNSVLNTFDSYVRRSVELYELITSEHGYELNYSVRSAIFEDLKSISYFTYEMNKFLKRLKTMIESL